MDIPKINFAIIYLSKVVQDWFETWASTRKIMNIFQNWLSDLNCVVKILDNWSLDRSVSMAQFKLIVRLRKIVHSRLHS